MIPFSGQLGSGALGKFELGVAAVVGTFVPHLSHAASAVASPVPASAVAGLGAASAVAAASPRSALTGRGAASSVSAVSPRSEVS